MEKIKTIASLIGLFLASWLFLLLTTPRAMHTESVLLNEPTDTHFKTLIMGASQGRTLERNGNDKLFSDTWNISKGGGHGGIYPEYLFLQQFYADGNSADKILYFLDVWPFYSQKWNEDNDFLSDEPLFASFFLRNWRTNPSVLASYVRSKFSLVWIRLKSLTQEPNREQVVLSSDSCAKQMKFDFPEGLNGETFVKYKTMFLDTLLLAERHNTRVQIIYPPSLCRKIMEDNLKRVFPGRDIVIADPKYFSDHNHLNSDGVKLLVPML